MLKNRIPESIIRDIEKVVPQEGLEYLLESMVNKPASEVFKVWNSKVQKAINKAVSQYLLHLVRSTECYEHENNNIPFVITRWDLEKFFDILIDRLKSPAKAEAFLNDAILKANDQLCSEMHEIHVVTDTAKHASGDNPKWEIVPIECVKEEEEPTFEFNMHPFVDEFTLGDEETEGTSEDGGVDDDINVEKNGGSPLLPFDTPHTGIHTQTSEDLADETAEYSGQMDIPDEDFELSEEPFYEDETEVDVSDESEVKVEAEESDEDEVETEAEESDEAEVETEESLTCEDVVEYAVPDENGIAEETAYLEHESEVTPTYDASADETPNDSDDDGTDDSAEAEKQERYLALIDVLNRHIKKLI